MQDITQAYRSVEPMLARIVSDFREQHGGDYEEMRSEVNISFLKAYNTYDSERSKFSTHVWTIAQRDLINLARANQAIKRSSKAIPLPDTLPSSPESSPLDFLKDLSQDAKTVIGLVLCPTSNVEQSIKTVASWKPTLTKYLRQIGWSGQDVLEAFTEIRRALVR